MSLPLTDTFEKHRKRDVVFAGAEGLDFRIGAWFLAHKIVGREAKNCEALILVFLIERFQAGVLGCVSALAGDVHDENNFAFEVGEGFRLAVDVVHFEVVNAGSGNQGGRAKQTLRSGKEY